MIFSLPFIADSTAIVDGETSAIAFREVNEYIVTNEGLREAYCADCRRTNMGVDRDCRAVVLGHVQRGGTPTPFDRTLATNFGYMAIKLLMKGVTGHLVVLKDGKLSSIPLSRVAGKIKTVPKNNHLIKAAKAVGTSFGI